MAGNLRPPRRIGWRRTLTLGSNIKTQDLSWKAEALSRAGMVPYELVRGEGGESAKGDKKGNLTRWGLV